jgi:hypothetical protein
MPVRDARLVEFAHHLREEGIAANATERAVRGETRKAKKDGIYRANQRGGSTYLRAQDEEVATNLVKEHTRTESGKRQLLETRREVENGWRAVGSLLANEGLHDLANDVWRFVDRLPPARTERELIADELQRRVREPKARDYRPRR